MALKVSRAGGRKLQLARRTDNDESLHQRGVFQLNAGSGYEEAKASMLIGILNLFLFDSLLERLGYRNAGFDKRDDFFAIQAYLWVQ